MSNNLRQIAKDLRSFVKRCKDVHYSDSLLITFLVTGLLTLAPKTLSADAIQEQQEVSAQAYDTITDLRQSFLRARQENEKSIKGAERELVMLMEQGDQVIKSPWASFQFATGFTNNDWRTSYRGRGGKYLEYYRRNNDLTKYVFDASKHQYGATNLHVQRNQEPNTLEINPANVHEPYRPYVPERLDAMVLPTAPEFNPYMAAPAGVTTYDFTYHGTSASRDENVTTSEAVASNNAYSHNNNIGVTYATNTGNTTNTSTTAGASSGLSKATVEIASGGAGKIYTGRSWWGGNSYNIGTVSSITGGNFSVGGGPYWNYNYGWTGYWSWNWSGDIAYSGVDINGANNNYSGTDDIANWNYTTWSSTDANQYAVHYRAAEIEAAARGLDFSTAYNNITVHWVNGTVLPPTVGHYEYRYNGGALTTVITPGSTSNPTINYGPTSAYAHTNVDAAILASNNLDISGVTIDIYDGNSPANKRRSGIISAANDVTMSGTNTIRARGQDTIGVRVDSGKFTSNATTSFTASGQSSAGIYLKAGAATSNGSTFTVNGYKANGINNTGGEVKVTGGTFGISGNEANGIYTKSKDTKTNGATFTISSPTKGTGIYADSGSANVEDTDSVFNITAGNNNNALYAKAGNVKTTGTDITIGGTTKNNGIFADTGTTSTTVNGPNSTIAVSNGVTESNGIYVHAGKLDVDNVTFNVNVGRTGGAANDKNAAIRLTTTGGVANVNRAEITVHGTDSAGIWAEAKADKLTVSNSNITIGNDAAGATNQYRNNGIYRDGRPLDSTNTSYTINGSYSNGVYSTGGQNVTFDGGTMTINGSYNNGYIDKGTATDKVKNMTFDVNGSHNNGVYATSAGGTIDEISGSTFNVTNNNIGLLVGDSAGAAKVNKIENTTFNIESTNAVTDNSGTAIYLYQSSDTKLGDGVKINGDGNDILITLRNRDHNNKITLGGTSGINSRTLLNATGNNNIGINIQNGSTDQTTTAEILTDGTKGWNLHFKGKNNTGIKNNLFANTLKIENKLGPNSSPSALYNSGVMSIIGDDGIMFANIGYVQNGTLRLDGINMQGKRSIGAAFLNNNYDSNPNTLNAVTGNNGIFNGTGGVALQGVIGANAGDALPSSNSAAIFANTGQRAALTENAVGHGNGTNTAIKDLTVTGLNVGLNQHANNSVLLWSEKGTKIKVTNTVTDYKSSGGTGHVSDGAMIDPVTGKTVHGYSTDDDVVSTGSAIAYATGYLDTGRHRYEHVPSISYLPSEIEFASGVNIDMVAKKGTALLANKGAKITAKSVRAGGIESILAYADGKHEIDATPTQIEIDGQIVAADNNLLGKNNVAGVLDAGKVKAGDLPKTYNNIAAYTTAGGTVTIKSADVSPTLLEETTTGKPLSIDAAPTKSLIFGMGAYATGDGSRVKFNNAKATVVSGVYGALYATNKGQIEFAGDIINQNNYGKTVSNKTTGSVTGIAAVETRNGRGTSGVTDNQGNITQNDHKNVTPFYVKRTVEGNTAVDDSGIVFNAATNIDMYDGILLTGNNYNVDNALGFGTAHNTIRDYHKDVTKPGGDEADKWTMAKYRGMSQVRAAIMEDNYAVELGVINQATGLKWNDDGNTNAVAATPATDNYLGSIGKNYAGGMGLVNAQVGTRKTADNTKVGNVFHSTLLNSELTINKKGANTVVNLENVDLTDDGIVNSSAVVDPFNDIKMESTLVKIDSKQKIKGDVANGYRAGQGLNMANSLNRWETPDNKTSKRIKTRNDQSGYINKGEIDVYGGTKASPITGLNVAFGTAQNVTDGSDVAKLKVDHGYGIYATDASIIKNTGKIEVTGMLTQLSTMRQNGGESAETVPSGNNYAIVGISDTNEVTYNVNDDWSQGINTLNIEQSGADGEIKVEGDFAVGIYGENRNNALASDIKIKYDNSARSKAGIDVSNAGVTSSDARGVGIALVNKSNTTYANGWANAGGELTLKGFAGGTLGVFGATKNDILTGKNGVGVYAESAEIKVDSDKFTVETKDNGVGLWAMDDTVVARGADHDKTFQYNYNGAKDKRGFAMAFGGRNTNPGYTTAANYMDIKFSNVADTQYVNLEKENDTNRTGTSKGIAGVLVNTNDAGDKVINYGKIEEDTSSVTNLRAYGAVVNKGTFINYGDIKLNDSLMMDKNKNITSADMKKVNVGILANDHSERARDNSFIENYADITIGKDANSKQNVGSWAIYGYNIKTGAKADGTDVTFKINRNSYGIYSGDGNVDIQKGTVLKVGNDTVLGHVPHDQVVDGVNYPIRRQTQYSDADDLLSGLDTPRERDSAIGVYIDSNQRLSREARDIKVNADMDIDRYSYGVVLAEKNGGADTTVTIGSATQSPVIKLASNKVAGGQVKSTKPHENPNLSKEVEEQGNAVYYYSADNRSRATSHANVTMNGDYNTAYFTKGQVVNYGTIDLRSQYDLELRNNDPTHEPVGYGNVGIISENTDENYASINRGTITTGLSDAQNMMYSVGMGAGRNYYTINNKGESVYDRTEGQGYVVNEGEIVVKEDAGIGMLATGRGSKAVNRGTITLVGNNAIGMYIDREAIGINEKTGVIKGNAQNLKGIVAVNGGYVKNYGTITVEGAGSTGIITDSSKFTLDANGNPVAYITDTDSAEYKAGVTAGQANGHGHADLYGGTETSIEEGTSGNPKTTGVGTTITRPDIVPLTTVTIDGVQTPIFELESDAVRQGDWAENITIRSSIQTAENSGQPLMGIGLWTRDEFGNPAWPRYRNEQLSEITSVGMYVDTSGVKYTNPINGLENLPNLGKVNLYFGPEITEYTNAKAIRIGDHYDENGVLVARSNILKPFNDALRRLPGGATVNALSSSLTWQVSANIDDNNQISELYMSKVPYHSFAYDDDKSLVNFTNNLDNIYEIARRGSEEKMIFNKLNSLGNGEGHILAQAFDQMRGHIYGGIQQRTKSTSDILSNEVAQLRSETNGSKDSNKFKAFGQRNEYKTDTAGIPDWKSNAGGMVYVHEDETVKLGEKSGFYAGVTNNYFTFKDLARSYENQAMAKAGVFKQTPLDENGTFTITVGGEGFFGRTDTKRRFWVVDKEFRAKSNYYTYGAGLNANLEKVFRINQGFSIVPSVGLNFEYGRFSTVNEDGDMALKVKSDDYYSIKPKAGIDFRYSQPVFKNSKFTASLGFSYENELGRLNEVENEARIKGAWTDYYTIKGDKEDRRGNFKSDLKLGLDNGRLGMTVNTGYDTKGHNFRAGLGLKVMY